MLGEVELVSQITLVVVTHDDGAITSLAMERRHKPIHLAAVVLPRHLGRSRSKRLL